MIAFTFEIVCIFMYKSGFNFAVESNSCLLCICITTLSEAFKKRQSRTFSRASRQLHVFSSSFDWCTVLSVPFVIGQSNYFSFGFTTLN